jgi:hypothetical protein
VPNKGDRPKEYGPKEVYINPEISVYNHKAASSRKKDKNPDLAEDDKETVKDIFISDPIHQCVDPKKKIRRIDDINKENIMKSCEDLAIDG